MQNHSIGFMGIMMIVMMGAMLFVLIFRRKKGKRRLFKKKEKPQVEPQLSHIQQSEL
jgi:preprotein translocase subunit YajC